MRNREYGISAITIHPVRAVDNASTKLKGRLLSSCVDYNDQAGLMIGWEGSR